MASPKKLRTLKVSYCTLNISDASNSGHLKISDGFSFGHFLCPKCKSSKKNFLIQICFFSILIITVEIDDKVPLNTAVC